jgi:hypothetical protein
LRVVNICLLHVPVLHRIQAALDQLILLAAAIDKQARILRIHLLFMISQQSCDMIFFNRGGIIHMRSNRYSVRKRHPVRKLIITLLIIAVAAGCIKVFLWDNIIDKISAKTYSQAVQSSSSGSDSSRQSTASSSGNSASSSVSTSNAAQAAENVYNNMSNTDKAKVRSIIIKHASPSNIAKVYGYVKNNDTSGLMQFAEQNLSSSEKQELYQLYEKYNK